MCLNRILFLFEIFEKSIKKNILQVEQYKSKAGQVVELVSNKCHHRYLPLITQILLLRMISFCTSTTAPEEMKPLRQTISRKK